MTCSSIVNSIGLVLDIIGAILLIKYGIPNKIDPEGTVHLDLEGEDQSEIKKARIYQKWSNMAISLIILGFVLQLISNFII
jgi:hypothetical protein